MGDKVDSWNGVAVSTLSYVTGLWGRCVAAARSVAGGTDWTTSRFDAVSEGHDAGDPTLLVYGQALWMAVTLVMLYALALLSVRLYFLVSFIGLLCNRVLFAPRGVTGRWWQVVNAVTWVCFAVLSYVIYLRVTAGPA